MKRLAALVMVLSCGGPPVPLATDSTTLFRFNVSDMIRPNLSRPPVGIAYGNIFLSEDVSISGPRSGAEEFGSVEMMLDLTGGISALDGGSFTTPKLANNSYTFLGFFDTNMNGSVTKDPDTGDPATLPMTNKFEISDAGQGKKTIVFDLIYN